MTGIIRPWAYAVLTGFAISFFIALFVRYGISFVLYLLDFWQVSTINTIILYAMLFILARIGIQIAGRRGKLKKTGTWTDDAIEEESESFDPFTAVWTIFAIFSVQWLTPALIIFWIYDPPYPKALIVLFVYVFSLATAGLYYFGNDEKYQSIVDRMIFFLSAVLGAVTVVNVFP